MWTVTVTAATLVAAVSSIELDKYQYHSARVQLCSDCTQFPACHSARSLNLVPVLANTTNYNLAGRTKFSRHRVAVSLNQQFWTELRKTAIRPSKIARSSLLL